MGKTPSNFVDLSDTKVGRLTILKKGSGRLTSGGQYKTTWICQCECGNLVEVDAQKLKRKTTLSCGCLRDEKVSRVNFKDISGEKFGRLTVLRYLEIKERENRNRNWLCECECGNIVQVNGAKLTSGHTQSCGCLVNEHIKNLNLKYKNPCKRLYSVYKAMLSRCYDTSNNRYSDYGERGIRVCNDWLGEYGYDSFSEWAFLNGYDEKAETGQLTLDRIDVNGNYEPTNCRWITNQEQQNNRRDCHYIEYNGEVHTVTEWARILGIPIAKMRYHIGKGKTIQEIMIFFGN